MCLVCNLNFLYKSSQVMLVFITLLQYQEGWKKEKSQLKLKYQEYYIYLHFYSTNFTQHCSYFCHC